MLKMIAPFLFKWIYHLPILIAAGSFTCTCPPGWALRTDGLTASGATDVMLGLMLCRSASSRSATADPSGGHSLDSSAAPPSECPVCSLALTSVLPRATRAGYSLGSRCRLRCRPGYRPDLGPGLSLRKLCLANATWTGGHGTCAPAPARCPPLAVPEHGAVTPASCAAGESAAGSSCTVSCRAGYTLAGGGTAVCGPARQWSYGPAPAPPSCRAPAYPPPFILCPPDMVKPLPPGSSSVYVMFPQPKTNVDWSR